MRNSVVLQLLFTGAVWTFIGPAWAGESFQVGGLLFSNPDNILGSGISDAQVDVVGPNGSFTVFSDPANATVPGLWVIPAVPAGNYTVTVTLTGWCFERWQGGQTTGPPPIDILVDATTESEVGSLNFLGAVGQNCAQGGCQLDRNCNDRDLCTLDTCDNGTCVFTPVSCPAGQSCDPADGQCAALGFCVFPPADDIDCDGLDDNTEDPCVGPPGTDNTLNRCIATGPATCGTADGSTSFQNCAVGDPVRMNVGGATLDDCLQDTWTTEINNPSGQVSNGNVPTDPTIVQGLMGCSDADTEFIIQTGRFADPLSRAYPVANGTYVVSLLMAESFDGACTPGFRFFDILVEGQTLETAFDPYATALALNGEGCGSVIVRSAVVTVADGALNISLDATTDNGILRAFEVLEVSTCTMDDDCPRGDQCSSFACVDGGCVPVPADDGTACDDGSLCTTKDACTAGVCDGTPVDCGGGVCNPDTGGCSGFCTFPPAGDSDCDGLDDNGDDPCVGPPGLENTLNRCAAGVALCGSAPPGDQDCTAGAALRLDLGSMADTATCNGEVWAEETPGSGNTSQGNVTADSVAVSGLFGCTDAATNQLVLSQRWNNPLERAYPLSSGTYIVNMIFSENFDMGCDAGAGFRVFDIILEGSTAIANFDQYATALALNGNGCGSPVVRSLFVDVDDDVLDISLPASANNGALKAIEVLGPLGCMDSGDCPASNDDCGVFECVKGVCELTMADDGTPCDDGDDCTESDACTAGSCGGTAIDCDDSDDCTSDDCSAGICAHDPVDCDDGNLCTTDSCAPVGGCANIPIDCPQGQACDPGTGQCTAGPGFCTAPPAGDMDCDGLDDATVDPCVGAAGPVNTLNRCMGVIADCADSGGAQQCAAGTALRLNLGGATTTDCAGAEWNAETNPTGTASSGNVVAEAGVVTGLFGCTDGPTEALILSTRFADPLTRTYPVENGTYIVNMLFSEAFSGRGTGCDGGVGWRVFDIAVEGTTLYTGFDQFAAALAENGVGCGSPVVRSAIVDVQDGALNLAFVPTADNGALKAVEVLRMTGCIEDKDCPQPPDACAAAVCNAGVCERTTAPDGTGCDDGDVCTEADACTSGVCLGTPLNCTDGDACTDDACVGGVCDNTPIDCNDQDACTVDGCTAGTCTNDPVDCDDGDTCTVDSCTDGMCANVPVDCTDGDPCTTDNCSGGDCMNDPIAGCCVVDDDCDDGLACTLDTCDRGTCAIEPIPGCCTTADDCDDGDVCSTDSCVGNVCDNSTIPDCCTADGDCDDGDDCTADNCVDNACVNSDIPECCTTDGECDDGDACTADSCVGNVCDNSTIPDCCTADGECDDGDDCTADSCVDNACVNSDIPECCTTDGECDDGDACTADSCIGNACDNGTIPDCCTADGECDDGDDCTADSCVDNACVNSDIPECCTTDGECDDGDACTADSCIGNACDNSTVPDCCTTDGDCDDDDDCTADSCLENLCVNDAIPDCCNDAADCDDGDLCTDDACDGGCFNHPIPGCCTTNAECFDDDACTNDACVDNACVNEAIPGCCNDAADCDDGDPCTDDDCDGICINDPIPGCCTTAADCDDTDLCTADDCVMGQCVNEPINECCAVDKDCDDGNPCTEDACLRGTCLSKPIGGCCTTPVDCDDSDPCTEDACIDNLCLNKPVGACCTEDGDCDDGDACTADSCVGNVCDNSAIPDCCTADGECDDGVPCTVDTCFQNMCFNQDTVCGKGEVCNTVTGACGIGCQGLGDCADMNGDTVRDDNCVWWECTLGGTCADTPTIFADLGGFIGDCPPDGVSDGNDQFHVLNCFADQDTSGPGSEYPCEDLPPPFAYNVDAGGVFGNCNPDGVCDGGDVFHVLSAFGQTTTCTCPSGGPAPAAPPQIVGRTTLDPDVHHRRAAPGEIIDITMYLGAGVDDLRGYQLHFATTGGRNGHIDIVDLTIEERPDAALAGLGGFQALNVETGQLLVGLDGPGRAVPAGAYLATVTLRISEDAVGRFALEVLHDDQDPALRTFLFATPITGRVAVDSAGTVIIDVGRKRGIGTRR